LGIELNPGFDLESDADVGVEAGTDDGEDTDVLLLAFSPSPAPLKEPR